MDWCITPRPWPPVSSRRPEVAASCVTRASCYYRCEHMKVPRIFLAFTLLLLGCAFLSAQSMQPQPSPAAHPIVLHAARLLDIESGKLTPGEVLVSGDGIVEAARCAPPARRSSTSATHAHARPD